MTARPALPLGQVLVGDARQQLRELPDAAVDTVITSPPYFAMRDYGMDDQIGADDHVEAWVEDLVGVCAELQRVVVPHGSMWLVLGDGYSRHPREGTARKSLLLGPQRLALRLVEAGWLLRNHTIWAKTNPTPSSVTDRLTTTHEFVYFFTRQPRYYFNLDAIREQPKRGTSRPRPAGRSPSYPPASAVPVLGRTPRINLNLGLVGMKDAGRDSHPLGKNPGDVWSIATGSYRGAHFATFPTELVRRPLLATCPERVCTSCGQPWRRTTQLIDGRKLAVGRLRGPCTCRAPARAGIVLDPFIGSGTTALAAEQHGRDWLGIELNPAYAQLTEQRLTDWRTTNQRT